MVRLLKAFLFLNPFGGSIPVSRVWLTRPSTRSSTLPIPNRHNYKQPLDILDTFFAKADKQKGDARHNRYLEIPGFPAILVTRDPGVIRAVLTATGDRDTQFDRDTMPSTGIARATGPDTLLFSNGPVWRRQRKASSKAFGKTALFQEDVFAEFENTFRSTVSERIALMQQLTKDGNDELEVQLEAEVKTIMMEMLLCNFFGVETDRDSIREKFIPAIDRVIDHIVADTIEHRFKFNPLRWIFPKKVNDQVKNDFAVFEELTDLAIEPRKRGAGAWARVDSEIPDEELRSNVKVFLAGALEATTSYACWALSHLARNPEMQQKVYEEVKPIDQFQTDVLQAAPNLAATLRETLRLTPSLYFLPRYATTNIEVKTADERTLIIPKRTHILLDVWHSNRIEEHWGVEASGYPADDFHPERWANIDAKGKQSKDFLHFGFGHGARVCPGKHLGELEVALVVGGIVKLFQFEAVHQDNFPKAGVSTKPSDGTRVRIRRREQ